MPHPNPSFEIPQPKGYDDPLLQQELSEAVLVQAIQNNTPEDRKLLHLGILRLLAIKRDGSFVTSRPEYVDDTGKVVARGSDEIAMFYLPNTARPGKYTAALEIIQAKEVAKSIEAGSYHQAVSAALADNPQGTVLESYQQPRQTDE